MVEESVEKGWTEAALSNSPTSSYEDLDERNGDCVASELSSFILISEGDSIEIPSSNPGLDLHPNARSSKSEPSDGKPYTREQGGCSASSKANHPRASISGTVERKVVAEMAQSTSRCREESVKVDKHEILCPKASSGLKKAATIVPALSGNSTAMVEPWVSQSEAILAKNANKDLKLKISKLNTTLDQKITEVEAQKQSIIELQVKVLGLLEERKKFERDACRKDSIIAHLELKLAETKTHHVQKVNQDQSKNIAELETANKELSLKNKELKEKCQHLVLENKTLFEWSSVLLTQVQDSDTKRAVETCERQVLERKIEFLLQELSKVRNELQKSKEKESKTENTTSSKWPPKRDDSSESILSRKRREVLQDQGSRLKVADNDRVEQKVRREVGSRTTVPTKGLDTSDRTEGVECPICCKKVFGSEAKVTMHVEHCIQLSEMKERRQSDNVDKLQNT